MAILDAQAPVRRERASAPRLAVLAAMTASTLACGPARGQTDEASPADALADGRFTLELRPRYNRIDESNKPERTEAVTYRAIAGWRSAPWQGLRLTLEAIHADHVGPHRFNDDGAQNATSRYPLLPDPRATDVNQAYLDYTEIKNLSVRAGRQVVRMDNQRFVSDNDFRQVPQLFDGMALSHVALEGLELGAAWFGRQRNTSGNEASLGLTLLRAAWNPAPGHAIDAYGYFHDQARNGATTGFADNSYRIAGVRAEGAIRLPPGLATVVDLPYVAEWATQRAFSGGDSRIDVPYWRIGAGASTDRWTLRYDQEVKGSNAGLYGLQTPLTDYYAFNGWALHFFNTPRFGLRDRWVTGRVQFGDVIVNAEAHRFRGDFGNMAYGRETDVGVTVPIVENCVLRLQNARYRPGSAQPPRACVTKTWLTPTYNY